MMLILSVRPFIHPIQNYVETFNEVFVLIIGYHMMVVAGYNIPAYTRACVGASGICCIVLLIIANILRWCVHIVQTIRLYVKRVQHRVHVRRAVSHGKVGKTRRKLAMKWVLATRM